jgi:predicted MFS family arabinose efflux permease
MRGGFMNINTSIMQLGTALAALISGSIVTKNASGELEHYPLVGYIGISIAFCCLIIAQFVKAGHTADATDIKTDAALAKNTQ